MNSYQNIENKNIESNRVSTGVDFLDELLNGGYEKDIITTIYGPAGSGKTNLCILFANSQAKKGKVLYIDTENGFSVERLKQINPEYNKLLQNIMFLKPKNFDEQTKSIELIDQEFKSTNCIIIDSIALLYRLELGKNQDAIDVNRSLGNQLLKLATISREKKIPIIITTQVYSDFSNNQNFKLVGGDLLSYISKTLIELDILNSKSNSLRVLTLKKHRNISEGKKKYFKILEKGLFEYDLKTKSIINYNKNPIFNDNISFSDNPQNEFANMNNTFMSTQNPNLTEEQTTSNINLESSKKTENDETAKRKEDDLPELNLNQNKEIKYNTQTKIEFIKNQSDKDIKNNEDKENEENEIFNNI